jgi:hypothetical protein
MLDPLTTLAFLTGSMTRIKLDTSVLVLSYGRPPAPPDDHRLFPRHALGSVVLAGWDR